MLRTVFMLLLSTAMVKCVSGPKLDSKLGYMNGDNYKRSGLILGVPVGETKSKESKSKKPESSK